MRANPPPGTLATREQAQDLNPEDVANRRHMTSVIFES